VFYDKIKITNISSRAEELQAWVLLVEEFPDHEDTELLKFYEWIKIAKKSNEVIGIVTLNKYLPKKALLCDIIIKPKYRNKGVGIKLLKEAGIALERQGYTHVVGFTSKKNKSALRTYKRIYTHQREMIVTEGELQISVPHIEQMEMRLQMRELRKDKLKK